MTNLADLDLPESLLKILEQAKGKKVTVAMSGGVDSSTTAALFKLAGAQVKGIHMITLPEEDPAFNSNAISRVKSRAEFLGIDFELFDARNIFQDKVINYFIENYLDGKAPNPCAPCNRFVKFGLLMEKAMENSDFYASGHYAISYFDGKRFCLKKPVDKYKDQTYILALLSQEVLSKALFPLGHIPKKRTKEIAIKLGLNIPENEESQDLCFMKCSRKEYLESKIDKTNLGGDMVDTNGNVLAKHDGIYSFAVGQRKGLGLQFKIPYFVKEIDAKNKKVVIAEFKELLRDKFKVKDLNYVSIEPLKLNESINAKVVVRNKLEPQDCILTNKGEFAEVKMLEKPIWAVAPGQPATFYSEDVALAAGFIFE